MLINTLVLALFSDWALIVLRGTVALIMIVHGWPKVKNLGATSQSFSAMGFRPGKFWGPLVAIVEFFGGLALIAGFYAQVVAALIAVEFLVVIFWKLIKRTAFKGDLELDLLIFVAALVLLTFGGGFYSLDKLLLLF